MASRLVYYQQVPPSDKTALEVVLESDWEREQLLAEENRLLSDVCTN